MPNGLRIHLYSLSRNGGRLLPYFFRHYDGLVDEYFVYDHGSTDGSFEQLKSHPRVHAERFTVSGDSVIDEKRRLSDTIWHRSRGKADWVFIADFDEHLYRPDLVSYLGNCARDGVTAIRSVGYDMVADEFPQSDARLIELVTRGCRSSGHSRLCIFNPDAVSASHFSHGRHHAWPEGHVVWPRSQEVLLLRYHQFGFDYVKSRNSDLGAELMQGDQDNGWGQEFRWEDRQIAEYLARMDAEAVAVPGLGESANLAPREYRGDEDVVEHSGLLDADWYLANHEDLVSSLADPLVHFCSYGWREGRRPNFYFDPNWYRAAYPQAAATGGNPLVHYIRHGEREGDHPSPHFDTGWYREHYGLRQEESPLRHYLLHRGSGRVSPLPSFDVEAYCRDRPQSVKTGMDPYERYLEEESFAANTEADDLYPGFDVILRKAGIEAKTDVYPANVPWNSLIDVIKVFLRAHPLNEAWYRKTYPDVDEAVRSRQFESAQAHFIEHGYFEGRASAPT